MHLRNTESTNSVVNLSLAYLSWIVSHHNHHLHSHLLHSHLLQIHHHQVHLQVASPPELHRANLFQSHHQTFQSFGEEGEQHMDLQVGSMELVAPLQVDKIVGIGEGTVDTDSLLLD